MRTSSFRKPDWSAVVWTLSAGIVVAVAAIALVASVDSGQADRSGKPDFDPRARDARRFLTDNLGDLLERGSAAYRKGDYETAARDYLAYLYRNTHDTRVLYNLARCYSRMGNAEAAVEVLSRAVEGGFVHPEFLESDEDFKPIRETRVFKDHQKQVAALGDRLGHTIPVVGPRVHRCRLRLPSAAVTGKAYPLVVGLHGNGGNAEEMMQSLTPEAFPGMICAAPEGAYSRDDLSFQPGPHFSWYMPGVDRASWPIVDPPTADYILAVVEEVSKTHPVSDVILLGFSQGVSAAYLTALKRPERFSAVVAFAGSLPRESITPEQLKAGNRLRIMIACGINDAQVGLQRSEQARDLLREAGYRVQFETFEGGHNLPPDMMRRTGQWIRSWSKR